MITDINVLVLLAMMVGTVGIVVPVLPGLLLVWLAFLGWAVTLPEGGGWLPFAVATVVCVAGVTSQYLVAGRRLRRAGIDTWLVAGALAVGVVGLFVVPVVGGPLGFVGTIYLVERLRRKGHGGAWIATRQALRAVALSIGIELGTAFVMMTIWALSVRLLQG